MKCIGHGPYFMFFNAVDTHRSVTYCLTPSPERRSIEAKHVQRSQRYQKISLVTPDSSLKIVRVGFRPTRPVVAKSTFRCSNETLNRIWRDGVRTVDMCSVGRGESSPAWEVTESGTRVYGQHWAPCRHGTRWGDKVVRFQVKIEEGGASWGIHMVANGLIFCLNAEKKTLSAFEGLADTSTVFSTIERASWSLEGAPLGEWLQVKTTARGSSVAVAINGLQVGVLHDLEIHPILGDSANNTGSVAFGGPSGWTALYRSLVIHDLNEHILYENSFLLDEAERILADFQVGTNNISCTIDSAKRDRACFGGDLRIMGQAVAHSTMDFEAIAGSIELLTNYQTKDGLLGTLCSIQAPLHTGEEEPPTYAFYSLGYALHLTVAIHDYWMQTGDSTLRSKVWSALEKLMSFTESFVNEQGLVAAPTPLSSKSAFPLVKILRLMKSKFLTVGPRTVHWFPMGGPISGVSGGLNLAYYDALQAMAKMSSSLPTRKSYAARAEELKQHILASDLYNRKCGVFRMGLGLPADGLCQDINAYAISLGISPPHQNDVMNLSLLGSNLPAAFKGLGHWDNAKVVSPYASGFAAEALFSRGHGRPAVNLIERIWGTMADPSSPNYSGGHWEAMNLDGSPFSHDSSLMQGRSTWPVFLLPRYLAGLKPLEAAWKKFEVSPVLADLETVEASLHTVSGKIAVTLHANETRCEMSLVAPSGTEAHIVAPSGWTVVGPSNVLQGTGKSVQIYFRRDDVLSSSAEELEDEEYRKQSVSKSTVEWRVPSPTRGVRVNRSFRNGIRRLLSC